MKNVKEVMVLMVNNKLIDMCSEIFDHYGSCEDCDHKVCCTACASAIMDHEVDAIARYLNISSKKFKKRYVVKVRNELGNISIVSRKLKEPCSFLKNGLCSVYPVRPRICRMYPFEVAANLGIVRIEGIDLCPVATVIGNEIRDYFEGVQHLFPPTDEQREYDKRIEAASEKAMDSIGKAYEKADIGLIDSQYTITSLLHLVGFYMARVLQNRDVEASLLTFKQDPQRLVEYIVKR